MDIVCKNTCLLSFVALLVLFYCKLSRAMAAEIDPHPTRQSCLQVYFETSKIAAKELSTYSADYCCGEWIFAGQEDSKKIREWFDNDLKGVDFGPLNTQDVLQNYGLASAVIPDAILTLAKTPGTSISELFTTPVNCPVPTVDPLNPKP